MPCEATCGYQLAWLSDLLRPHYIIGIYHKSVAIFSSLDIYHSDRLVAYSCTVAMEKHLARLSFLSPYSLQNVCMVTKITLSVLIFSRYV